MEFQNKKENTQNNLKYNNKIWIFKEKIFNSFRNKLSKNKIWEMGPLF